MENSVTIADLVLARFEAPSEVSFSENNIVYLKKKKTTDVLDQSAC